MSVGGESVRVILFALLANLGIAVAKFIGAIVTGSASMMAEAVHSLVDSSNQVLLLIGSKKAQTPASDAHPLGYGREAFFWSFVVAIVLFSLGGLFAIYEGAHKILEHEEVKAPVVGLIILIVSLVLEGLSFRACVLAVKKQNPYGSLWKWLKKTTSAELLVIFTEDAAAILGLGIATVCLLVSWVTGDSFWDALGSILVGSVLVTVAVFLAIEIKSLIIGEAAETDFKPFLEKEIASHIPGGSLLRLIALQLGGNEVLLSFKVSPGSITDVDQLITAINALEAATKRAFPQVRWLFVEPDTQA